MSGLTESTEVFSSDICSLPCRKLIEGIIEGVLETERGTESDKRRRERVMQR
jgi:hypothetical protein